MPDPHVTDEDIHSAAGTGELRVPAGVPRGTCLACGQEHVVFYAAQAHDCRINLAERAQYAEWLERFRRWGLGVLRSPADMKFPPDKMVSGRTALTFHMQSDLAISEGTTLETHQLDDKYYFSPKWLGSSFSISLFKQVVS